MENQKLRVWYKGSRKEFLYPVKSVVDAIKWIDKWTKRDLKDESVAWNAMGLEYFDENFEGGTWCEYYDEEGRDVMEIIEERDEDNN